MEQAIGTKEYYCQKGRCNAQVRPYLNELLPRDFNCQKLFARNKDKVLCSIPIIEGAARKVPICRVYETFKVGKKPSRRIVQKYNPFSRYGYLSILESAGIDPL